MWRTSTGSEVMRSAEECPGDECHHDHDAGDDEHDVSTMGYPSAARIHSHARDGRRAGRTGSDPDDAGGRGGRAQVIGSAGSHRMLLARAARALSAASQSGSAMRRTKELWASHFAEHDVHVSRNEPPE